jgi:hypothetical protein
MSIYTALDVHKATSQLAVEDESGVLLREERLENDPELIEEFPNSLPARTSIVLESSSDSWRRKWALRFGLQVDVSNAKDLFPYLLLVQLRPGISRPKMYDRVRQLVPRVWRDMKTVNPVLLTLFTRREAFRFGEGRGVITHDAGSAGRECSLQHHGRKQQCLAG